MFGLSLSESLDTPLPFNTFLFLFFHSHGESFKCILGRVTRITNSGVKTNAVSYPKTPTALSGEYQIKLMANDFQLYYGLFDRLEAKRTNKELKLPNWTPTTRTCAHVLHEVTLLRFWLVNRFIFVNFVYRVRRVEDKRDNWLTPNYLVFVISGYKSCFPEILVHSPKGKQKYYAEGLAEI